MSMLPETRRMNTSLSPSGPHRGNSSKYGLLVTRMAPVPSARAVKMLQLVVLGHESNARSLPFADHAGSKFRRPLRISTDGVPPPGLTVKIEVDGVPGV